jgi:hypothetical protein
LKSFVLFVVQLPGLVLSTLNGPDNFASAGGKHLFSFASAKRFPTTDSRGKLFYRLVQQAVEQQPVS